MLLNLPNILTFFRIVCIPLLVVLLAVQTGLSDVLALIVYFLACVTDYFDGAIARKRNQLSELGRMLDPIADKLLVGALLVALAGLGHLKFFSLYAAIIILLREIAISGLREFMATHQDKIPSTRLAKWKTGLQMLALGFLIIGEKGIIRLHLAWLPASMLGAVLLWIAVVPTIMSGWGYLKAGAKRLKTVQ
ncbi:CDP-diacylglycerol--glycerol-3-phosphate 3-phosphatidyltransferase [Aristophania vespae]|uniref:CDP-diacylglycerol--glycerol-3-phosphate 3-phosphatidyltransferase n=1 Tax=Aristophania vespae TaxID=2697033 RepID=A0A6P1ND64_9PROT|nr:CDP-diacylglycerol--glycerol-3-phosphate 3-phosphatidyltransferase [Aristophania vespae]QHI95458.1 CDP-diacylglycerol--glycerol-3-phosphate 3-phosphatidyltransferase [Aristophania vespae]UMM64756.1 CDP-diacylglycerol--glycerol-3-phosphate 3-phosphatidyltransferase [Aristophania vespae]